MPSQDFKRSDRIADLIKVEISKVLSTEVKDPRIQGITVLGVQLTPDMKKADISISPSNSFNSLDPSSIATSLNEEGMLLKAFLIIKIPKGNIPQV